MTPSPDTVEPTEADRQALHDAYRAIADGSFVAGSKIIRQHVAAEVARETAGLRDYMSELEEQCDSIGLQKAQHAAGFTAHKSSPPPPAS